MLSISFFALGFTAKGSRFFSREFSCLPLSVGSVGRTTFSVVAQAFCLMPNFRGTQGGVRSQSHRSVSSAYCAFGIGVVQLGYRGNPISCVVRVFRVRPSAGGHADGPSWLPFSLPFGTRCRILEELASTHSRRSYGGKIHTRCRYSLFTLDVLLTLCMYLPQCDDSVAFVLFPPRHRLSSTH